MEQQDWDDLKDQMGSPWGTMRLQCDDFEVTLQQSCCARSHSFATMVYVNGVMKGAWMSADKEGNPKHEEARRFLRRRTRRVHSAKVVADWRKAFGKKEADEMAAKKVVLFDPTWTSFSSLKKHLLANNTSITRLPE